MNIIKDGAERVSKFKNKEKFTSKKLLLADTSFENIVGQCIKNNIKNLEEYHLEKEVNMPFIRNKRWDYVIYKNNNPKIFVECNFYNTTGSKPIETANAYVDLQQQIGKEYTFIWVTDGKGWEKMSTNLQKVYHGIDYILNYKMLNKHIKQFLN